MLFLPTDVLHPDHAVYSFALVLGVLHIREFRLVLEKGVIAHNSLWTHSLTRHSKTKPVEYAYQLKVSKRARLSASAGIAAKLVYLLLNRKPIQPLREERS
jgi:hypothetical protein